MIPRIPLRAYRLFIACGANHLNRFRDLGRQRKANFLKVKARLWFHRESRERCEWLAPHVMEGRQARNGMWGVGDGSVDQSRERFEWLAPHEMEGRQARNGMCGMGA